MGIAVIGAIIVYAGSKLSKHGDELSEVSGLSSTWIGIILLALITSIPELASCVTAAASGVPDIGMGNVFGSNMFNMFIIAVLDFLQGPGPVLLSVSATQILPASLGIFLMSVAAGGIYTAYHYCEVAREAVQDVLPGVAPDAVQKVAQEAALGSAAFWGWAFSFVILFGWIVGAFILYKAEQTTISDEEFIHKASPEELRRIIFKFSIAALVVIICGIILVGFAKELAVRSFSIGSMNFTLGNSFVGTIIVAFVTSLPELVVAISAYRIGAVNMAIANLFGSNTFNIMLIPLMDFVYGSKSIIANVQPYHILTAAFAIILTTVAIMGVVYRSRKSFLFLGWDALAILLFYLLGTYLIFQITIQIG